MYQPLPTAEPTPAVQAAVAAWRDHAPMVPKPYETGVPRCIRCDFTVSDTAGAPDWRDQIDAHRQTMALAAALVGLGVSNLGQVADTHTLTLNASAGRWECQGCPHVHGPTPHHRGGITTEQAREAHRTHRDAALRAAILGGAA